MAITHYGRDVEVDAIFATPRVVTGTVTSAIDVIPSTEVLGRWVSIQFDNTGGWAATVQFEQSNNGTNWLGLPLLNAVNSQGTANFPLNSSVVNANNTLHHGPCAMKLFRVRCSAYTSGTITATAVISALPSVMQVQDVNSEMRLENVTDGILAASTSTGAVLAQGLGWNGVNTSLLRVPTTFKTVTATASGDTALWTPASGKKFRLMRYQVQITAAASAAAAADLDIVFRDGTTGLAASFSVFVPGAAGTTFGNTATSGLVDLGNGILSAAANNMLNINLSAALTSGKVRVVCCGTEE